MITKHLLDEIVKLFFVYTPPELVFNGKISDQRFPEREFLELMRCYLHEYSETEARLIHQFYLQQKDDNVYLVLVKVARELLTIKKNKICCKYNEILRWRKLSGKLGEDLLICAFLADTFQKYGSKWKNFGWEIVLGHDNKQLNAIMEEGISDNHFHLFGSAPVFPLTWLRMMNNVQKGKYTAGLMGITLSQRNHRYDIGEIKEKFPLNVLMLQAVLMRAIMYIYVQNLDEEENFKKDIPKYFQILESGSDIIYMQYEIDQLITTLKLQATCPGNTKDINDYALCNMEEIGEDSDWLFGGERRLIYEMLCDILVLHRLPHAVHRLLYPYLIIRTYFRGEMIQNNETIGFENFSVYSKRKKYFLPTSPQNSFVGARWRQKECAENLKRLVRHAVFESFSSGNLRSLEIRICPMEDFASNVKQIETYDRLLRKNDNGEDMLSLNQFFYVLHFSKHPDKIVTKGNTGQPRCRHWRLRKDLKKQMHAIIKMRHIRPEIACRIRGIDACSLEIHCRPEVFAVVFRTLRMDVPSIMDMQTETYVIEEYYRDDIEEWKENEKVRVPQLAVTYHVGEDFLDPIDGMRALDEAIHFLEMGQGDRFGHATVLGLDLEKWYRKKHNQIYLQYQDYLDNVVWFYMKIIEFQISDCETLKDYLLKEFLKSFHEIYYDIDNLSDIEIRDIDIFTYYEAWKLRGDDPKLYENGIFEEGKVWGTSQKLITSNFPQEEQNRRNRIIAALYYSYHYDEGVKRRGAQPKEIILPEMYVWGAILIQKKMQYEISRRGIGIETNPSSNLKISTMDNYDEHPILNLYTLGLEDNRDVPQMFLSINTDDRGIFHTSLENEYAFLAASLENLTDENGEKRYLPQQIYDWLDHIRKMGNQQVF